MLPEFLFNYPSLVKLRTLSSTFMPNVRVSWEHLKELDLRCCRLPDLVIENILCGSPSLESLDLANYVGFDQLVIASKSLKKLELRELGIKVLEISCPNLRELHLFGCSGVMRTKFMNLSSLICATLDFEYDVEEGYDVTSHKKILQQLQHVEELTFGTKFTEILAYIEDPPLLNNKCLTLDCPDFDEHHVGIKCALQNSHFLEKLVIQKELFHKAADLPDLKISERNYWNSSRTVFNCLVSHLKFLHFINLSKRDVDYEHVINFIEFLLKNAKVLEKLVVVLEDDEKDLVIEVSLKLLSFPRSSQQAVVELLYFGRHCMETDADS